MCAQPVEEILQAGSDERVFSIVTRPAAVDPARPVFVFLNSGLLHRVGPVRMSVLLARRLAGMGFVSVRVDLSGKGDTPPGPIADYVASVHDDYAQVYAALAHRWGQVNTVLGGLCSGADNAVRLAAENTHVVGMWLLDAYCFAGRHDRFWALVETYGHWQQYVGKLRELTHKTARHGRSEETTVGDEDSSDPVLALRALPTEDETRHAVSAIHQRGGSTLAIFTSYAARYYRRRGQFAETTMPEAFDARSIEHYWRDVNHTYKRRSQLARLLSTSEAWAQRFKAQT